MELSLIDTSIANRSLVKVRDGHGWAAGTVGILLGYRASYDNVKVGFIDESGEYTGEYTTVPRSSVYLAPAGTPDIVSTVTAYGNSIEIRTPKTAMDSQHVHTVKFFAAYNELRDREATRMREAGESEAFIALAVGKPKKIHSRENPSRVTTDPRNGPVKPWRPVFPLDTWSAPNPLSDREALKRARQLHGKDNVVQGVSVGQITFEELA